MKCLKLSILFCISAIFLSNAQTEFIFRIETTTNNQVFTVPAEGTGINYNVDWGDTNSDANVTSSIPHTYATPGEYTITITGSLPWFRVNNNPDIRDMILSIEQWGTNQWQSMQDAFAGCTNLVLNATDTPNLSNVSSMNGMFFQASSFVDNGGAIGNWDVSAVRLMASLFQGTAFNSNINNWNMQSVENIDDMFAQTTHFNQPLNNWQLPNLTTLVGVFSQSEAFNQDIGNWDVSSIGAFQGMFDEAIAFNQSLGQWDISSATNLSDMLRFSGLSPENYDATLIGWATLNAGETQIPINITLGANLLQYCLSENERTILTNAPFNWTINGDVQNCGDPFITTWQTTMANETITIPTNPGIDYRYTINWGDGSAPETITSGAPPLHQYTNAGIYTVEISGIFPQIGFNNTGDKDKILSIDNWGDTSWASFMDAFLGCSNLVLNATDSPNLSRVNTMQNMFRGATAFVDNGGAIGSWDVSTITEMTGLFQGTESFNSNINTWNVSNVAFMSIMFANNPVFNQPLDNWDVSNVEGFQGMFNDATMFDRSLGNWDISSATNLSGMLDNSGLSIENYDNTLTGWATLDAGETQIPVNITLNSNGLQYCFSESQRTLLTNAPFNWTINGDTLGCSSAFITTWQTTSANETITVPTFSGETYNYSINWGDGSPIETVTTDVSPSHSYTTPGVYTISIGGTFPRIFFNNTGDRNKILSIEQWGTIEWSSMEDAFYGCSNLRLLAADAPNLSMATSLDSIFRDCTSLQSPNLSGWDVSTITDLGGVFWGASNFNGNIGNWDVGNVETFIFSFHSATNFNQDISGWNIGERITTNTIDMRRVFQNTGEFNQPIGSWDMSKVNDMSNMFSDAVKFNQPLENWDVSNIRLMQGMFNGATEFNQNLGNWDISSATNLINMLVNTGLSLINYDATLIGWATLDTGETQIPTNITLGADGLTYCNSATERTTLTSAPFNWIITGDTLDCTTLSADNITTATIEFSVYPNPVSHILYLEDAGQHLTKVEVFNINGQNVYSKTTHLDQIDMQSFDTGLYMIKLHAQSSTKTLKIVKK